ncbi:hypothetical protein DL93DRAFT_2098699 [Clavulina sp. PMI_390]|nr:hypothetical protein DL93DRAFT_2098699 [Clavulina sp. PMI_390]
MDALLKQYDTPSGQNHDSQRAHHDSFGTSDYSERPSSLAHPGFLSGYAKASSVTIGDDSLAYTTSIDTHSNVSSAPVTPAKKRTQVSNASFPVTPRHSRHMDASKSCIYPATPQTPSPPPRRKVATSSAFDVGSREFPFIAMSQHPNMSSAELNTSSDLVPLRFMENLDGDNEYDDEDVFGSTLLVTSRWSRKEEFGDTASTSAQAGSPATCLSPHLAVEAMRSGSLYSDPTDVDFDPRAEVQSASNFPFRTSDPGPFVMQGNHAVHINELPKSPEAKVGSMKSSHSSWRRPFSGTVARAWAILRRK